MGRTLWADGEILLASSAERRAASALVLVELVGGVGPLTRRLPRHAYAGCITNPLIGHANIPSAHKLQPDAAHSAPTQPPVIKSKSLCSRLPLRGVRCVKFPTCEWSPAPDPNLIREICGHGRVDPSGLRRARDKAIGERLREWIPLKRKSLILSDASGGQGGIRTHGRLAPTAVFKTAALNHSATCPYHPPSSEAALPSHHTSVVGNSGKV